jgi:TfoX N-terminal domain
MARDKGLEELVNDELRSVHGITEKAMFGGWAWLLNGNLLCGARDDGLLVRLGKDNEAWALRMPGIVPMISGARRMYGWVRADSQAFGDDALRQELVTRAIDFVRTLPAK